MAYDTFAAGIEYEEGQPVENAIAYLQAKWHQFLELSPSIIDLQHRAAVIAAEAQQEGDATTHDQAKAVVTALAKLQTAHDWVLNKIEAVRDVVGLSGWGTAPTQLGAIPIAQVTIITTVALVVVWFFRAFAAEERKLDLIEAGVLTPEEAAALDAGPMPGNVLGSVAEIGKVLLVGFALWLAYRAWEGYRSNPTLQVFDVNPPEAFGEEVYAVWYRHADDGNPYVHEFGRDVEMTALEDGSVLFEHRRGLPLWRDFDVS